MVKPPRIKHSKSSGGPVTIDLGKDDVKRMDASATPQTAARPDATRSEASATAGEASMSKSDSGASATASASAQPNTMPAGKTTASDATGTKPLGGEPVSTPRAQAEPKTGSGASDATRPTPSAFGRDAGKTPPGEQTKAAPPPKAAPAPRRGSPIAAGLIGGLIVLAGAGGAYYAGLLPDRGQTVVAGGDASAALAADLAALREEFAALRDNAAAPAQPDVSGIQASIEALQSRMEAMGVLVEESRAQITELRAAPATSGEVPAELTGRLDALEQRVAAIPEAGSTDALAAQVAELQQSLQAIGDQARTASEAAGASGPRLDAMEQQLASLSAQLAEQAERPGVALAIAASALKAAIDRGQPFMAELETYASIAPDAAEIAALREMAASGVPTAAAIESETDDAAVAMIAAGRTVDPQSGLVDRLWASAQSLVTVRPVGVIEGSDVPAIVARMEAAVQSGDYTAALAEFETLPADAKAAGEAFAAKIRARQTADQLIGKALADALRA